MARVVILTGSPHYEGSSQKLADNFEKGVREAGNHIYRYDAGLQGDSQPHFLQLEHAPGMEVGIPDNDEVEKKVIPELLDADVVVLVSSLYYFEINAQLKTVIDRFYDYNHELKDKKMIFMMAGYGTQEDMDAVKLHMQKLSDYMRWQMIDQIYADDSWNKQKLAKFAQAAYNLGKSIK
ncbi:MULTISPECIES: flavodoxin family protein [Lactobacillus]|jgi:multimeric flavodoxin WrbA|uniref:NAD(P)H-dependent oxidoreductase n=1 Tax=Lactobacillus paragasseri TaxID=2107999 RepID=A0AAQ2K706_9LACO|nr:MULTISPECIES: NAD(P)H-dependent oxidoreductase [Lactobacillus]MDE3334380.1 NAD(P)H-dependent oxidoreductase [Lactobacillus paragasseri]MDE3382931.1 NAD(P)H-dependent oxidoreductase [Lactobacillus paragasseri]MDE3398046.1 NAD(P)H-dependent oxidoreductase [Lactobacillus paragasseri]MDK6868699.1 NAD(P)H-dependent oxidoreductase [Lactobacillus paragasseri]MDK7120024.1 NAD(P)H-dependent oxidoreductase [Lactobacillus paragasseri]